METREQSCHPLKGNGADISGGESLSKSIFEKLQSLKLPSLALAVTIPVLNGCKPQMQSDAAAESHNPILRTLNMNSGATMPLTEAHALANGFALVAKNLSLLSSALQGNTSGPSEQQLARISKLAEVAWIGVEGLLKNPNLSGARAEFAALSLELEGLATAPRVEALLTSLASVERSIVTCNEAITVLAPATQIHSMVTVKTQLAETRELVGKVISEAKKAPGYMASESSGPELQKTAFRIDALSATFDGMLTNTFFVTLKDSIIVTRSNLVTFADWIRTVSAREANWSYQDARVIPLMAAAEAGYAGATTIEAAVDSELSAVEKALVLQVRPVASTNAIVANSSTNTITAPQANPTGGSATVVYTHSHVYHPFGCYYSPFWYWNSGFRYDGPTGYRAGGSSSFVHSTSTAEGKFGGAGSAVKGAVSGISGMRSSGGSEAHQGSVSHGESGSHSPNASKGGSAGSTGGGSHASSEGHSSAAGGSHSSSTGGSHSSGTGGSHSTSGSSGGHSSGFGHSSGGHSSGT